MVWVEMVCDGCNSNPIGETFRNGSIARIRREAREAGWRTVQGKNYCPECYEQMKKLRRRQKVGEENED